jgi:sugar/nucleoside kinase (ribokinase family)
MKDFLIVGMGAALVDILADVSEEILAEIGSPKGSMSLVSDQEAFAIEEKITVLHQAPGGSTANTIAGIAALGYNTGFVGKIGNDPLGAYLTTDMQRLKTGFTAPINMQAPTGRSIVLITPDGERTMHTLLGASGSITPDDLDQTMLANTEILFSEAYLWDSPAGAEAFRAAASIVRANGGKVALSLADPFCVERHHASLENDLHSTIDLVLANEAESEAMFGTQNKAQLATAVRGFGIEAAITLGADGAILISAEEVVNVAANAVSNIVDLTGAGDQFAAGFLAGIGQGKDLQTSGRMGTMAAASIITHVGARPQADIRAMLETAGLL